MNKTIVFSTAIIAIALFGFAVIFIQTDRQLIAEPDETKESNMMKTSMRTTKNLNDYTVSARGSAHEFIAPDRLRIWIGVETVAKTAANALKENNEKTVEIIKAIKSTGIEESEIGTAQFNIYPQYNYDREFNDKSLIGFSVSNKVQLDTDKLELASEIIDLAVSAGANTIDRLSFDLSTELEEKISDKLITMAIKDAKQRANKLIEELDVKIIGVKKIAISDNYYDYPVQSVFADSKASTPIFSQDQIVNVNVDVVFLIENL